MTMDAIGLEVSVDARARRTPRKRLSIDPSTSTAHPCRKGTLVTALQTRRRTLSWILAFGLAGCSGGGGAGDDAGTSDAGVTPVEDGGASDGGADASADDAGAVADAGPGDAGMPDAGMPDAGATSRCGDGEIGLDEACDPAAPSTPCCAFDCTGPAPIGTECGQDPDAAGCAATPTCDGTAAETSSCMARTEADLSPCTDDGLFCTGAEVCLGGTCTSQGNPCVGADGDGDCAETCDDGADTCMGHDPDEAACDDGNASTSDEACVAGQCIGTCTTGNLNVLDDGTMGTRSLPPLVISEIDPQDHIEVWNTTAEPIVLAESTAQFCSPFAYRALASLAPDTVVPPGGYATLPWPNTFTDMDAGGEVILYADNRFGNSQSIDDFVCWGVNPHSSRLGQATDVGKWVGACALASTGGSIQRRPFTVGTSAADYDTASAASPTMGCF